jgi:hypothetical protein
MANPQLTVKQFAMLTLNQAEPPWHLGKLLQTYNVSSVPLKASIANLSSAQAVIYVSIRSASVLPQTFLVASRLPPGETQAQQNVWSRYIWPYVWDGGPDKSDLEEFNSILAKVGAYIVYLSPAQNNQPYAQNPYIAPWVVVGFAGTFGALASLPVLELSFDPDDWSGTEWGIVQNFSGAGTIMVDAAQGSQCSLLVNYYAGDDVNTIYSVDTWPNPPIASMYLLNVAPGITNTEPLGALGIYMANNPSGLQPAQMTASQLIADHLQVMRETMINLIVNTIIIQTGTTTSDGIAGALQTLTAYLAWLTYLATANITDLPPTASVSWVGDSIVTIPQLAFQPVDQSEPPIVVSQFILLPDGTTTGGVVSG